MPIYEYRCSNCGHLFEKLILDRSQTSNLHCPECGHQDVRIQLSVFAAHSKSGSASDAPMCPSGGPCPTPEICGLK